VFVTGGSTIPENVGTEGLSVEIKLRNAVLCSHTCLLRTPDDVRVVVRAVMLRLVTLGKIRRVMLGRFLLHVPHIPSDVLPVHVSSVDTFVRFLHDFGGFNSLQDFLPAEIANADFLSFLRGFLRHGYSPCG
jgi:hypothetical protein